ncbi:MAG: tetratricopeptide repeat protein [Proteobacteria bacterium]|nr:tetratricopeptide repeat protein [Pseudomonadota bacterium]
MLTLLFNLAGCNLTQVKEEKESKHDLFEIQKKADTAYINDDLKSSEEGYQILIQELPEIALHWFRLGNIYVRTNRPATAINLYREAVLRDPKYGKAWYNLSIVQLKQTAYSLNEMLLYTDINDPLYDKAKNMLEGIYAIIKQE